MRATRTVVVCFAAGCSIFPPHPSCPEGTRVEKHFGEGTSKGMACSRELATGHKQGFGWQITFFDRGTGFYGPDPAHATNFLIVCSEENDSSSLSADEIARLMRSTTVNPDCQGRPLQPLWQEFTTELTSWYINQGKAPEQ
jgi:hypothetical protein